MSAAAVQQADERIVYCECGCGEPTNLVHLTVLDMRTAGMKNRQIAAVTGYSYEYVKVLAAAARRGDWKRFRKGHFAYTNAGDQRPRKRCEMPWCKNKIPAFWHHCTDHDCGAARMAYRWSGDIEQGWTRYWDIQERHEGRHVAYQWDRAVRDVMRAQRRHARRMAREREAANVREWRDNLRLERQAERARLVAERLRLREEARERRQLEREQEAAVVRVWREARQEAVRRQHEERRRLRRQTWIDQQDAKALDRVVRAVLRSETRQGRSEEINRRREERSAERQANAEWREFWRTVGRAEVRHLQLQQRWRQRAADREFIAKRREERRVRRAFDGIRTSTTSTPPVRGPQLNEDESISRRVSDPWSDPTLDEIENRIAPGAAEFINYAKAAPIIPDEFIRRCAEGELVLLVDDDGVRFLQLRKRSRDLIPRFDPGVAIPDQASGMKGRKSSSHRGRHAASMATRGKRPSKKPRVNR